jgi:hypothetical protein
VLLILLGCGSSGNVETSQYINEWLKIIPPEYYIDNVTKIDPYRDLKYWKVYAININDNAWFSAENEIAVLPVIDNNVIMTEFDMSNLKVHLPVGEYFIATRVETVDGEISDFSNVVIWENK